MRSKIFKDNKCLDGIEYLFTVHIDKEPETKIRSIKEELEPHEEGAVGFIYARVNKCQLMTFIRSSKNFENVRKYEEFVANTDFCVLELSGGIYTDAIGNSECIINYDDDLTSVDSEIIDYALNRIEEALYDDLFESEEISPITEISVVTDNDNVNESTLEVFEENGYNIVYYDEENTVYFSKILEYSEPKQKKPLNIFISQPMSGLEVKKIIADRSKARADLINHFSDYEVNIIDNEQFDRPSDWKKTDYMSYDIKCMGDADIVYFLEGWESHRGCRIEHTVASEYGFKIMYAEQLEDK